MCQKKQIENKIQAAYYQLVFLVLYTKDASFDPNQHQQSGHLDVRHEEKTESKIRLR